MTTTRPRSNPDQRQPATPLRRVLVLGASGSIGRAVVAALQARGHAVTAFVRPAAATGAVPAAETRSRPAAAAAVQIWSGAITAPGALSAATDPGGGLRGRGIEVVVSCLASRSGVAADAWAVDHAAQLQALRAAEAAGVGQWLQLSAICLQKPQLAFQHAKLAFEAELRASPLAWSIVRPTAYFKSLSGQVGRVRAGKPYLVFGDGRLTACKPIADTDLASYIADGIDAAQRQRCVLPIGGPGPALTPHEQGLLLFERAGRPPRFKQVPLALLDGIAAGLGGLGRALPMLPVLAAKAELARIGRYYASESMLVWDAAAQRYDADATPAFGQATLAEHFSRCLSGEIDDQRREHAVF